MSLWTDLCDLCNRWLLLGGSVTVQWVPSHVGVQGNEGNEGNKDEGVLRGSAQAFRAVLRDREVGTFGVSWASKRWPNPVMII